MDFANVLGIDPKAAVFVILNLILLESLLSIDNAAVLATMVLDLPKEQRSKALRYGILGAYIFRGICLVFSAFLIKITWLKVLGGLYLIRLTYQYFKSKQEAGEGSEEAINKTENKAYQMTIGKLGPFWATVVAVEIMDLAFSIDNVFAAVALSSNIILVCIGVGIGIFAMRFAAQIFVSLIERFPFLEQTAFVVIGLLGVKLIASYIAEATKSPVMMHLINSHHSDMWFSLITVAIFVLPIVTSLLFNFPKHAKPGEGATEESSDKEEASHV